jgi:protein-S-isoprenylcysteine O-methyltransferase Ste14
MGVSYSTDGKAYFLGLTHNQGMEAFISLSALGSMLFLCSYPHSTIAHLTNSNGERKSLTVKRGTVVQVLASLLPPAAYLTGVMRNGLENPGSIMKWAIYQPGFVGIGWKAAIRATACFGLFYLWRTTNRSINRDRSSAQEKCQFTRMGKYRIVRHPFYSGALIQSLLYIPMFWSYAPFAALGVTTIAVAIKIPVEEKLLEDDSISGPAYKSYKEKVAWKVIPYLW